MTSDDVFINYSSFKREYINMKVLHHKPQQNARIDGVKSLRANNSMESNA